MSLRDADVIGKRCGLKKIRLPEGNFFLELGTMGDSGQDILGLSGVALYGARWQSPLARDLGTSDRNLRYWFSGKHAAPPDLNDRLITLLQERGDRLKAVIALIDSAQSQKQRHDPPPKDVTSK